MNVTDDNFQTEVLDYKGLVMVDFWAIWCGPCRMMAPTVEEIAQEKKDVLKVVKVNIEEESAIPERYQILGIPTLLFFKDGKLVDTLARLQTKESIIETVERNL